jgi:Fur family ferric uptake transcriptional regulator
MRVRGDQERGLVERDVGLRFREQGGEASGDVQGPTVAPRRAGSLGAMSGTAAPSADQVRETVAARLRAVGQRLTPSRTALLDVLTADARPLTIPEILDGRPDLAQSSAYRNLVVLEEAGVVRRVVGTDEFARWELTEDLAGHHHHLICASCGRVEDVPASAGLERSVAAAAAAITRTTGFHTQHHRLDLVGVCESCS